MNRRRSLVDLQRHLRLHLEPFFGRRRMSAITTADVRRYVARRQRDVFTRPDGEAIGSFNKRWATACRGAGVPGRVLYDFRRTAVRNLLRAGVPERIAMQLVGWKSRQMLDRYHIVSAADLLEAARKLDAARSSSAQHR